MSRALIAAAIRRFHAAKSNTPPPAGVSPSRYDQYLRDILRSEERHTSSICARRTPRVNTTRRRGAALDLMSASCHFARTADERATLVSIAAHDSAAYGDVAPPMPIRRILTSQEMTHAPREAPPRIVPGPKRAGRDAHIPPPAICAFGAPCRLDAAARSMICPARRGRHKRATRASAPLIPMLLAYTPARASTNRTQWVPHFARERDAQPPCDAGLAGRARITSL